MNDGYFCQKYTAASQTTYDTFVYIIQLVLQSFLKDVLNADIFSEEKLRRIRLTSRAPAFIGSNAKNTIE